MTGLKPSRFSAAELAKAHLDAIEKARALNAYVLRDARAGACHGEGLGREDRARARARPLEGIPLGIKDLFCTEGVVSTAGSNILKTFEPPYEFDHHAQSLGTTAP